jgi:hypothetical protein
MSSARELVNEFFDCLNYLSTPIDRCVKLFAEDGVFEIPCFRTLEIHARYEAKTPFEVPSSQFDRTSRRSLCRTSMSTS